MTNTKTIKEQTASTVAGIKNSRFGWAFNEKGHNPSFPHREDTDVKTALTMLQHINKDIRKIEAVQPFHRANALAGFAFGCFAFACATLGGAPVVSAAMLNSRRALLSSITAKPAMNRVFTPAGLFGMSASCVALGYGSALAATAGQDGWQLEELHKQRLRVWGGLVAGSFVNGNKMSRSEAEGLFTPAGGQVSEHEIMAAGSHNI